MSAQDQAPNISAIKEKQQKTWTSGNYAMVGNLLVIMGERLCEAVDLRAGDKVLDVATGSGNTAISAARRFCEVTAIDYVPELIEQAKSRAQAERLEVSFEVGDAEHLSYADASFDVVLSTLGVMFAPRPGEGRGRDASGLPARGEDRPCQLDPRRLHRRNVSHHRQAPTPSPRHKAAPLVGHRRAAVGAPGPRRLFPEDYAPKLRLAVSVGGVLCRVLPRLLRTDAEGIRVARRGRPGSPSAGPKRVVRGVEHLGRRDARGAVGVLGGGGRKALIALWGDGRRGLGDPYRRARRTG